jgi:hypothetical protein
VAGDTVDDIPRGEQELKPEWADGLVKALPGIRPIVNVRLAVEDLALSDVGHDSAHDRGYDRGQENGSWVHDAPPAAVTSPHRRRFGVCLPADGRRQYSADWAVAQLGQVSLNFSVFFPPITGRKSIKPDEATT